MAADNANAKVKHPDDLLEGIGRSIMTKALVYSIVGHVVVTVLTSIPLFKDWTVYGIKAPTTINAIRTEENRKKEEEDRRAKAAAKAEAEAKAAAEAKSAAPAKADQAKPASPAAGAAAAPDAKTPPEVQPLPPKRDFEYGDDLSLD